LLNATTQQLNAELAEQNLEVDLANGATSHEHLAVLGLATGTTITGPSGATAAFATIARTDGTSQVTYNHWPLYYYAGDSKAGDTTGQNVGKVWFVMPLNGQFSAAAPAASPSASSGY
jgi:hypothetical protein